VYSYTASGSGAMGGNQVALAACAKQDMGVFIISPNDKGGE
jgi:predicted aldo/keto reductase-like oxidoreductase